MRTVLGPPIGTQGVALLMPSTTKIQMLHSGNLNICVQAPYVILLHCDEELSECKLRVSPIIPAAISMLDGKQEKHHNIIQFPNSGSCVMPLHS